MPAMSASVRLVGWPQRLSAAVTTRAATTAARNTPRSTAGSPPDGTSSWATFVATAVPSMSGATAIAHPSASSASHGRPPPTRRLVAAIVAPALEP